MNELEYAFDTINGTPFEKLAADYLRAKGYEVHESGLKGTDGGWDARVEMGGQHGIAHASTQNDWRRKIRKDARKVHSLEEERGEDYDLFVFVTNKEINGVQELDFEDELRSEYGWNVKILHRDTILGDLRTNHHDLAERHLGVELGDDRDHLEDIRELVDERIEVVRNRDGIVEHLQDGSVVALHVVPNGITSNERKSFSGDHPPAPILWELPQYRSEARGKTIVSHFPELETPWESYGQIRNDGLVETATATGITDWKEDQYLQLNVNRGGLGLDATTVITVRRALAALADLGFTGSATVSISLLDAAGTSPPERNRGLRPFRGPTELQTDVYTTEPVAVTIGSDTVLADLEPALSEIWRELGKGTGTENIEDGEWAGNEVRLSHETLLPRPEETE
jgi:hypothetical protein